MKKLIVFIFLIPIIGFSQNKKELIATVNRLKTDSTKLKETVDKKLEDINNLLESIDKLKKQYESEKSELNSKIETQNLKNIQIKKINKKYEDSLSSYISFIKAILKPEFQEINIGSQVWMKKNLDVSTFRNGDTIPQLISNEEWKAALENKIPAWCYYNNDVLNGDKYGKIYNFWAIQDQRGLAPKGWHIPSQTEFQNLLKHYDAKEDYENLNEVFTEGYLHCLKIVKLLDFSGFESNDAFIELIKTINRVEEACSFKEITYNQTTYLGEPIQSGYHQDDKGGAVIGHKIGDFSAFKMLKKKGGFNLSFGGYRDGSGEFIAEYGYEFLHSSNFKKWENDFGEKRTSTEILIVEFGDNGELFFTNLMHYPEGTQDYFLLDGYDDLVLKEMTTNKEWRFFHIRAELQNHGISESGYVRCIKD